MYIKFNLNLYYLDQYVVIFTVSIGISCLYYLDQYVVIFTVSIGISCISTKHAALRSKSKDWLAQDNVMCPSGVALNRQLFQ
jgi:hypothetical protein